MNITLSNYRGARIVVKDKIATVTARGDKTTLRVCGGATAMIAVVRAMNIVDVLLRVAPPESVIAQRLADKYLIKQGE